MSEFICLTVGFMVGLFAGVTTMCVMQINRLNNLESRKDEM